MISYLKLLRRFRRGVRALLACLVLAPVAVVWDSLPAAPAGRALTTIGSQASSTTTLYVAALTGSNLTFRAKVSGVPDSAATPTGSVTFAIEGSSGPVQCDGLTNTLPMSGGVATCKVTSALSASGLPDTAWATYSGDNNFTTSVGGLYTSDGNFNSSVPTTPTTSTTTTSTTTTTTTTTTTAPTTITTTQPSGTAGFGQPVMQVPNGYSLSQQVMDEKFAGTSLDSNWSHVMGGPCPDIPAWGGNGTPVVNNGLTLTNIGTYSVVDTCDPSTGRSLFTFPSGGFYLQVNFKTTDTANGFWPAIWFPYDNGIHPNANEIDLFEGGMTGYQNGSVIPYNHDIEMNYGGCSCQDSQWQQYFYNYASDVTQSFTTVGMEWVPGNHVNFYVGQGANRVLVGSDTNAANIGAFANYNLVMTPQGTPGGSGWHSQGPGTGSMYIAEVQVYSR